MLQSEVLDLGTMAVLVGTVALGLEKVSMDGSPVAAQIKNIEQMCAQAITQLDPIIYTRSPTGAITINRPYDCRDFFHRWRGRP